MGKTEIANTMGISPISQRFMSDAGLEEISDQVNIGKLFEHQDVPSLKFVRLDTSKNLNAPRSMEIDFCKGSARVKWCIEANKCRSSSRSIVSPAFDLDFGGGSNPSKY